MCDMTGYDLLFEEDGGIKVVPHFCRTLNCGGSMSLETAREHITRYYFQQLQELKSSLSDLEKWVDGTHPEYRYYKERENETHDK